MSQSSSTVLGNGSAKGVKKDVPAWQQFYRKLAKNKAALAGAFIVLAIILVAILAPLLAPFDPLETDMSRRLLGPTMDHWFGTDDLGRDIFSRVLYGARISLTVGIGATILGASVGIVVGLISGYYGKRVDTIIMRICDVMLAFPGILLALAIVSILGGSTLNVIIAIAIFAIPTFARIVRGSTLSVKKLEYIDAIKTMGASDLRILFKHVLPNILSPIIVQATLYIASAIVIAASLSFLGLGTQRPTPEWGTMLSDGRQFIRQAPHMIIFPGLMIFLVVTGFNLFGDGLRDALEPKKRK